MGFNFGSLSISHFVPLRDTKKKGNKREGIYFLYPAIHFLSSCFPSSFFHPLLLLLQALQTCSKTNILKGRKVEKSPSVTVLCPSFLSSASPFFFLLPPHRHSSLFPRSSASLFNILHPRSFPLLFFPFSPFFYFPHSAFSPPSSLYTPSLSIDLSSSYYFHLSSPLLSTLVFSFPVSPLINFPCSPSLSLSLPPLLFSASVSFSSLPSLPQYPGNC